MGSSNTPHFFLAILLFFKIMVWNSEKTKSNYTISIKSNKMKTLKLFCKICLIILLMVVTKTAVARNQTDQNTQYPVWHYFDDALGDIGTDPFALSGDTSFIAPNTNFCNRGIGASVRYALSLNNTNAIYKYAVDDIGSEGWYILQIDGDYKVEMSNDNTDWTTVLEAVNPVAWTNKGPAKSNAAYAIDLKPFLPSYDLYVRFSDNGLNLSNGATVYNALITGLGYPNFYAGGGEPQNGTGGQYPGDQQFLFQKNYTSDRESGGRFADGNILGINGQSNTFTYKFDLPDDNDDCDLIAYVSQQYKIDISTNWDFSTIFYSTQSLDTADVQQKIRIKLKPILSQSSDNIVYFRISDADPSDGWGGDLRRLWIAPQIYAGGKSFTSRDELETAFMWDNQDSGFISAWGLRYADMNNYVSYRFNIGPDITDSSYIRIDTAGGFLWQGSSNGIDWVDLFVRSDGNTDAKVLLIHPKTGELTGEGAVSSPPVLLNPYYEGWDNVFFLRMKDVTPGGGNGGQMFTITTYAPSPAPAINTIYPVWHYFDTTTKFASDRIGGQYYINEGGGGQAGPWSSHPNRGNGSIGRMGMFMDASGYVTMKYPMDMDCTQAWYILQVDNQYSIELSNDNLNWSTAFTPDPSLLSPATHDLRWFDKGITNMAPYYFDLAALGLLPTSNIYVKLADAETSGGWGSLAWNALITKCGYPSFYGGGNEPDTSGLIGDQQWLFTKDFSSDRINDGRFADGDVSNTFSYKFDLPDGEDDCTLHVRINGNFLMGISTNYLICIDRNYTFTDTDIIISNTTGDVQTNFYLNIPLSNVLAQIDNNVIYTYFEDLTVTDGWGPNVMDFWITKHQSLTQALVNAATEEELPFLWQNTRSQVNVTDNGTKSRQTLSPESFIYVFEIKEIADTIEYNFDVGNEYAIDVSTNTVDWFNIFTAVNNEPKGGVSYNPYTAEAIGVGAVSNVPGFYMIGDSQNKIYFRFRDSIVGDTIKCSVYKAWTKDAIPEPALLLSGLLLGLAFLRRK